MALGDSILTVSEAVDRYMGVSGYNSPSFKAQYLIRGLEIWKDIRNNVLRTPSHKWARVDKTKLPYRLSMPSCAAMFINVGGLNKCGEYVNYGQYNGMHSVDFEETTDPECTCEPGIKECITTTETTTETITIDGEDYTKTVETRVSSNGDVYVKTTQPIQRLDATGQPIVLNFLSFEFTVKMIILNAGHPSLALYDDTSAYADNQFHLNGAVSDIHYYNGIYDDATGEKYWGNDGIEDMFRGMFAHYSVGITGYSNRGISEIGGNLADTPEAYAEWRSQLEAHTLYELFDKRGVVVESVTTEHVSSVTASNQTTHTAKLKIIIPDTGEPVHPELNTLMFNGNVTNEWNFSVADPVENWEYANITERDAVHKLTAFETGIRGGSVVDMVVSEELICHLETKPCGCVVLSQENLDVIESCCCPETVTQCRDLCQNKFTQPKVDGLTRNDAGYYKYDEGTRVLYLYGDIPDQVLINFQSSGEGEEDEIMPVFALMTFYKGMDWLNSRYSASMDRFAKRELAADYSNGKRELEISLPRNKLDISTWDDNTIGIWSKW